MGASYQPFCRGERGRAYRIRARLKYAIKISRNIKCKCCTVYRHPRGYRKSPRYPMLRGENHCPHCLCAPCVIALPPDFLKGSCDAHPANAEKRHRLYRMFWGLLTELCFFKDPEYLRGKERRTVRDDRREILPTCVIQV